MKLQILLSRATQIKRQILQAGQLNKRHRWLQLERPNIGRVGHNDNDDVGGVGISTHCGVSLNNKGVRFDLTVYFLSSVFTQL